MVECPLLFIVPCDFDLCFLDAILHWGHLSLYYDPTLVISLMPISSPNPMFDHLLESSHRDDSYKWSNIGFGDDMTQEESIEVDFTHLILISEFNTSVYL